MTTDEARKVLNIMQHCDGECSSCVRPLYAMFARSFPEYTQVVQEQWKANFDYEDDLDIEAALR